MDDPKHFERRNSDLHNFRNFGRTKSFTYGETAGPACPPLAFAAASAAIGRRGGTGEKTIAEEDNDMEGAGTPCPGGGSGTGAGAGVGGGTDSSPNGGTGDSSDEVDMSPCPRIVLGSMKPNQASVQQSHSNSNSHSSFAIANAKASSTFGGGGEKGHIALGKGPIFGSAKTRTLGRLGFQRVASYAGTGSSSVFKQ
jgi:M-phase inducer tyrosine phosphatase